MIEHISIDENLQEPKYMQIVNSILDHILLGNISFNTKMPSLRALGKALNLSRDTVDQAYNILRERKIIISVKGKGNYVSETELISELKILFLTTKMDTYELDVFNSFNDNISKNTQIDLKIFDSEESLYTNLLKKHLGAYTHYVIMSNTKVEEIKYGSKKENINKVLQQFNKENLILINDMSLGLDGDVVEIYHDVENDVYDALLDGFYKIKKYNRLVLAYRNKSISPDHERIAKGIQRFCNEKSLEFQVIDEITDDLTLKKGDLFITLEEDDLLKLVNQVRESYFEMGSEIGILSYNEDPLKEILGISVLTSDLKNMGETAAKMIVNDKKGKLKSPFHFISRKSL